MKKIVIKIGTRVLTDKDGKLNKDVIQDIVRQVSKILDSKMSVLIVSSGAIGAGMGLLNIKKRPQGLAELQSMASIGQTHLMDVYNEYFNKGGYLTGQILLTQDDFDAGTQLYNGTPKPFVGIPKVGRSNLGLKGETQKDIFEGFYTGNTPKETMLYAQLDKSKIIPVRLSRKA